MTSNNALSQFADLSPEQRQLLFEKIRQKKLNSARRPVTQGAQASDNPLQPSPHQTALFKRHTDGLENRLVELTFHGNLELSALQAKLQQLHGIYPSLGAKLDSESQTFSLNNTPQVEHLQWNSASDTSVEQQLAALRQNLQQRPHQQQALHIVLVQQSDQPSHLLLAVHPLLLDSYSLLRLGNQLLAMLFTPVTDIELPEQCSQSGFASWSQQMLDKKFLANEWQRLAPKSLAEQPDVAPCANGRRQSEALSQAFIEEHLPVGISAKQWLCAAVNQCLYSWLSHQSITYWFSDPSLKDSTFENLLGYFPYYVPVQSQKTDGQRFNAATQFAQSHTRYSAVSEHLAQHLCQHGSPVPTVHYHWFDVDNAVAGFELLSVQHHHCGLMLAPFEVHIIEQANKIELSIHFDSDRMGTDQIQFLVRDLLALLKQDSHNDPASRPSLADQLRAIWKDLLQAPDIAPGKSFFELGGHSLQVTEMKFRIKQQLKLDIPISVLYELPTIEKLSSFILATHGNSLGWVPEGQSDETEEEEGTL